MAWAIPSLPTFLLLLGIFVELTRQGQRQRDEETKRRDRERAARNRAAIKRWLGFGRGR